MMPKAPLRSVPLGPTDFSCEQRADGSLVLRSTQPLGAYPDRVTDRLLHWAGLEGLQYNLKEALFKAYFSDGQNPSDHATLAIIAESVGLDIQRAAEILASDEYAAEVREQEELWITRGVTSVPTIVFNDQYAVSGGQPAEAFVGAIRQIIQEAKA